MQPTVVRVDRYLAELGVAVGLLAVANLLLSPHDPGFLSIHPNPALLLAALIGARYGVREGIMAGGVVGGLLLVCALLRAEELTLRTVARVDTYLTPLLVLATGFAFGAVGESRRRKILDLHGRVDALEQELADQAVRFMAAAEAKHELERRVSEESESLSSLYATARTLEILDVDRLYPAITATMRRLLQCDACQLYLLDGELLRLRAAEGPPPPRAEVALDEGLPGFALRAGKPVSVREFMVVSSLDDLQQAPVLLAAPLAGPEGATLGCLTVTHLPFLRLTPVTLDRLGIVADWAARALENARIHQKARAATITDELVRSYTYAYYQRRLEEEQARAERYGRPLCVIVFRIHGLELVALERRPELGRILGLVFSHSLRAVDLVCRYATDDSFAIILPETGGRKAEGVVARLSRELSGFHFLPYVEEARELEFNMRVLAVHEARDGKVRRS